VGVAVTAAGTSRSSGMTHSVRDSSDGDSDENDSEGNTSNSKRNPNKKVLPPMRIADHRANLDPTVFVSPAECNYRHGESCYYEQNFYSRSGRGKSVSEAWSEAGGSSSASSENGHVEELVRGGQLYNGDDGYDAYFSGLGDLEDELLSRLSSKAEAVSRKGKGRLHNDIIFEVENRNCTENLTCLTLMLGG
jgi:hypothetical protein